MEFEKITIEMFYDNLWVDITQNVVTSNGFQLTPRIDGTFMVGTFDAWLSYKSIPAYTPLKIIYTPEDEEELPNAIYLVATSTSNKYMLEANQYYHSFDLFEATAILSNFIVGSKAFSVKGTNKKDSDKIKIIKDLMQQKYGITMQYQSNIVSYFTKEREFSFGAGTTLYNALVAIMEEYNYIPFVTSITSNTNFWLKWINKNEATAISYSNDELTKVTYKQDLDNYCKYLETEASGVVDRTNTTTWKNLTVRSEDTLINNDHCCILLPCNVEEVKELRTDIELEVEAYIRNEDENYMISRFTNVTTASSGVITTTSASFNDIFDYLADYSYDDDEETKQAAKESTQLYQIFNLMFKELFNQIFTYDEMVFLLDSYRRTSGKTTGYWVLSAVEGRYRFKLEEALFNKISVIQFLKEKSEWDTLELENQPHFMYYELGTNSIKNLYKYYKDDFWGVITQEREDPWFYQITYSTQATTGDYTYGEYHCRDYDSLYNIMEALFDVTAVVQTNPLIINEKSIELEPLNESAWKPYARSYDAKSNSIEFDKLEERMQIANNMLGDVELELEVTNPAFIPLISTSDVYNINFENVDYYVTNYVINFKLDNVVIVYSLSRNQSKKADVIGVDTQFEATPNPLKNIITRPIYINSEFGLNVNLDEYYLLRFKFYDSQNNLINTLFKRFSILQNENTKLLYIETINQYTFDYKMTEVPDNITNDYQNQPIPYVNEYNEAYKVDIDLVMPNLSNVSVVDFSRELPKQHTDASFAVYTLASDVVLYKDAREHLTFTIKLNKEVL